MRQMAASRQSWSVLVGLGSSARSRAHSARSSRCSAAAWRLAARATSRQSGSENLLRLAGVVAGCALALEDCRFQGRQGKRGEDFDGMTSARGRSGLWWVLYRIDPSEEPPDRRFRTEHPDLALASFVHSWSCPDWRVARRRGGEIRVTPRLYRPVDCLSDWARRWAGLWQRERSRGWMQALRRSRRRGRSRQVPAGGSSTRRSGEKVADAMPPGALPAQAESKPTKASRPVVMGSRVGVAGSRDSVGQGPPGSWKHKAYGSHVAQSTPYAQALESGDAGGMRVGLLRCRTSGRSCYGVGR